MGQERCSRQAGQQDTGPACLTTEQIGSSQLSSVESQGSVTDFGFWKRKGHLEGICCSPSGRLRWENVVAVCANWRGVILATHLSASGNGCVFQASHHETQSINKSQDLLGADSKLVMISGYEGHCVFDVTEMCVACVPFGSSNGGIITVTTVLVVKPRWQCQTLCFLSSSGFLCFPRDECQLSAGSYFMLWGQLHSHPPGRFPSLYSMPTQTPYSSPFLGIPGKKNHPHGTLMADRLYCTLGSTDGLCVLTEKTS